ncbi:uncharacterized protein LOC144767498 isoform X2 [Lissotriton helveticus]
MASTCFVCLGLLKTRRQEHKPGLLFSTDSRTSLEYESLHVLWDAAMPTQHNIAQTAHNRKLTTQKCENCQSSPTL